MNAPNEPRRLKLMADYFCWALWEDDPENGHFDNVDPASLPLLPETVAQLRKWIAIFSEGARQMPDDPTWTREKHAFIESEGLRLWRLVRKELGAAYRVAYKGLRRIEPEEDP